VSQLLFKKDQIKNRYKHKYIHKKILLLTNLVLKSEILNNVLENKSITRQEIIEVYENSKKNTNDLFLTAQNLRIKNKGNTVTFSKKAFFNIEKCLF